MKKRERVIQENIELLKSLKNGFLEEARLYKQKHPDWDKMPDFKDVHVIFCIFPVVLDTKRLAETAFFRTHIDKIDEWSISISYILTQKPTMFNSGGDFKYNFEIKTSEFNKTWFMSKEIATEEVIRRIESGEVFDPAMYDFTPLDMLKALNFGKAHK